MLREKIIRFGEKEWRRPYGIILRLDSQQMELKDKQLRTLQTVRQHWPSYMNETLLWRQTIWNSMKTVKSVLDNKQSIEAMGTLLYISPMAFLDITAAVGMLCRKTDPWAKNWNAAKRLAKYLNGTTHVKLKLSTSDNLEQWNTWVQIRPDSTNRKSISRHVFFSGRIAVSWSSKKQEMNCSFCPYALLSSTLVPHWCFLHYLISLHSSAV